MNNNQQGDKHADKNSEGDMTARRKRRMFTAVGVVGAAAGIAAVAVMMRSGPASGVRPATEAPAAVGDKKAESGAATGDDRARGAVHLPPQATSKNPVRTVTAQMARLAGDIQVIGNVSYDADHFAIVGPLVSGRMTRLFVGVGDRVRHGQAMAEIESTDVGEARGALISAKARLGASEANLHRERELAEKRISSAREREVAEAQWASEGAMLRAAEERLRAIGFTEGDIRAVQAKVAGGRVAVRAPIDGKVIERLVTLGQAVERATDAFKVANLTSVWVLLDLYEKDLSRVRVGQAVEVRTDAYPGEIFHGRIGYVSPVIDEGTRTSKVRVEIDNKSGKLNIGQLVNAKLVGNADATTAPVLTVPRGAVQRVEGKPMVFVKGAQGFERRVVELGVSGGDLVEIRNGVRAGEEIATDGAFLLKSEFLR